MKVSYRLNNKEPNSKGEKQIYARIKGKNSKGKVEECTIGTGVYTEDKYFNKGSLSSRCPSYSNKNRTLNSIYTDLEYIKSILIEEKIVPSPKIVKKRYNEHLESRELSSPRLLSFWSAYDEFVEIRKHRTRGYLKTLKTLRNRIEEYEKWQNIKLTFEYLSTHSNTFQSQFQDYLWTERKLSNSYVNKLLSNLSHFLYYCDKQNYISKRPKFRYNKDIDRDEKIYLYKEEVLKLYKSTKYDYKEGKEYKNPHIYIIEDKLEGTKSKKFGGIRYYTNWELVKDIFLFLCSIGCRYSDIPHFKVNHFNFDKKKRAFSWVQQKTNKRVSVPSNDISNSIFIKYSAGKSLTQHLFPKLSNQKYNKSLKLVLKDLEFKRLVSYPKMVGSKVINNEDRFLWELISSHAGRRTFIKNMIDMGTMDYQSIMALSGHRTMSQFQKYISVSPHDLTKAEKLYQLQTDENKNDIEELMKLFVQLDENKRKTVLDVVKSMV